MTSGGGRPTEDTSPDLGSRPTLLRPFRARSSTPVSLSFPFWSIMLFKFLTEPRKLQEPSPETSSNQASPGRGLSGEHCLTERTRQHSPLSRRPERTRGPGSTPGVRHSTVTKLGHHETHRRQLEAHTNPITAIPLNVRQCQVHRTAVECSSKNRCIQIYQAIHSTEGRAKGHRQQSAKPCNARLSWFLQKQVVGVGVGDYSRLKNKITKT